MIKKLNNFRIKERLRKSFNWVILIFVVVSVCIAAIMMYSNNDYKKILDTYAYPQGDIALAMNGSAEVRSSLRGMIAYDSDELIASMKTQYDAAVTDFEECLEEIRPTMVTEEGLACMDAIDKAWAELLEVGDKIQKVGATTDQKASLEAQNMMSDEYVPKYNALDQALLELMSVNVEKGNAERTLLNSIIFFGYIFMAAAILTAIAFAGRLSMVISKSIEVPLSQLSDRFISFAEGDLDSPLPEIKTKDEISDLIDSISAMAVRLNLIVKDEGRLLNEMANGNFAVETECEEQYTGVFNSLLMGMRQMNHQIDATIRGVDDASRQVEVGSSNLSESAQALAEGATEQAATVEEMQATINDLSAGIQNTAVELENSYKEAQRYAGTAEDSRADMEDLMGAMQRISEASEKIGNIIAEIEDIASQTNLLSLNASIEAARAGDAGRGFAVVADQIRTLAEQSAKSAVDSRELIEASIYEVGEGSKIATKASDSLKEVVVGVQKIAESAKKMSDVSRTQAAGMEQADIAVAKIAEVVQNNSAAAQETSATSEELTAQATTLNDMVSQFKLRD